jgi:hypothetical protein
MEGVLDALHGPTLAARQDITDRLLLLSRALSPPTYPAALGRDRCRLGVAVRPVRRRPLIQHRQSGVARPANHEEGRHRTAGQSEPAPPGADHGQSDHADRVQRVDRAPYPPNRDAAASCGQECLADLPNAEESSRGTCPAVKLHTGQRPGYVVRRDE